MKKIMNEPDTLIADELQGFAKIYPRDGGLLLLLQHSGEEGIQETA